MADFTTGDGCHIAYRWDGPTGAQPLILSNSLGTTMDMWAPQIDAISRRFRVLRYDARGHGDSAAPTGSYSMDRLGRDVVELMDGLGVFTASFCGLSMGGMVGQWLGVHAPSRLDRLILANTSAYMGPPSSWDARIGVVREKGMGALTEAVLERWFTPPFQSACEPSIEPVRAMLLATAREGYAGCCAAIRDMDMRPVVHLVSARTLVIGGAVDPATPPSHAEFLASQISGASLVMLEAAHLSNVEQPEAFARALLDYLDK